MSAEKLEVLYTGKNRSFFLLIMRRISVTLDEYCAISEIIKTIITQVTSFYQIVNFTIYIYIYMKML